MLIFFYSFICFCTFEHNLLNPENFTNMASSIQNKLVEAFDLSWNKWETDLYSNSQYMVHLKRNVSVATL